MISIDWQVVINEAINEAMKPKLETEFHRGEERARIDLVKEMNRLKAELSKARKDIDELRAANAKLARVWNEGNEELKTMEAAAICLDSLIWLDSRDKYMKAMGAAEWIREDASRLEGYFDKANKECLKKAEEIEIEAEILYNGGAKQ
jgi:hypothetical protein